MPIGDSVVEVAALIEVTKHLERDRRLRERLRERVEKVEEKESERKAAKAYIRKSWFAA